MAEVPCVVRYPVAATYYLMMASTTFVVLLLLGSNVTAHLPRESWQVTLEFGFRLIGTELQHLKAFDPDATRDTIWGAWKAQPPSGANLLDGTAPHHLMRCNSSKYKFYYSSQIPNCGTELIQRYAL